MMIYQWMALVLALWITIYPATDFCIRRLAPSVIRRGNVSGKRLHLSFDDGPDPQYTLELLNILKDLKVKATFFLVGEKAARHPELVRQIIGEGHHIGIHTQYHRHAYLMGPAKSVDSIVRGKKVLEELSGQPLVYFRPPWGALNLFEYWAVRHMGLKVVLWSANARDWEKSTGVAGILERLGRKLSPNTIIVLHDSGGETGAPRNTLAAVPKMIIDFQSQGYQFISLSEITGGYHDRS
jgi:peptidoglycan/xylan/chitin deacetylase (PgdA/CDA1 family)